MSELEIAVLSRKVADLEADNATLRRGMVMQLSATGRLTKALFDLDDARFGGRHQRAASEGRSPGHEVVIAERIVDAVAQATAEPTSSDDLAAARLRAETAEMARQEAERAVADLMAKRSAADDIRAELARAHEEIMRVQAQAQADHEAATQRIQELEQRVGDTREALAREQDLRRADQAEARSLGAEIHRLAGSDPESRKADDFEITLSVLQDALRTAAGLDAMGSAAEAVLVGWSRILTERAASASQELATLRWQLDDARRRDGEQQAEIARRTEHERTEAIAREAVRRELAEVRHRCATAEEALRAAEAAHRDAIAALHDTVDRARQRAQDAEHAAADVRGQLTAAREEESRARSRAEVVERELAQARAAHERAVADADHTRRDAAAEQQRLTAKAEALERALLEAQAAASAAREAERQVRDLCATATTRATQAEEAQRAAVAAHEAERVQRHAITAERDRLAEAAASERRRTGSETAEAKERLQAEILAHATTVAERDRARADLAAATAELAGLRDEWRRQAGDAGTRVAESDHRRVEAEEAHRRVTARVADLEGQLARLTAEREQWEQSGRERTGRLSTAEQHIAELTARMERAEAEARTAARRVEQTRADVRREYEELLHAARAAVIKARGAVGSA